MADRATMRISEQDLLDPRVEGYLEEQAVINRASPEIPEQSLFARIFYSSYFYLGLSGILGALAGWACCEPLFHEHGPKTDTDHIGLILLFPMVAAMIGLFI